MEAFQWRRHPGKGGQSRRAGDRGRDGRRQYLLSAQGGQSRLSPRKQSYIGLPVERHRTLLRHGGRGQHQQKCSVILPGAERGRPTNRRTCRVLERRGSDPIVGNLCTVIPWPNRRQTAYNSPIKSCLRAQAKLKQKNIRRTTQ